MQKRLETIHDSAAYLREKIGFLKPTVGIILGSGLGRLADEITEQVVIPYSAIPGFPVSTAIGHKGNLILGLLGGKHVMAMQGRFHFYEGYSMDQVTLPVRVMKLLGIQYLFVSNAAGGNNPDYKIGELVIIKDHIRFMPDPLLGQNLNEFGPRFPDMTCAYDAQLRKLAHEVGEEMGITLPEGVYFAATGPCYETPAEVRFYRMIGVDLQGMSTIPEVIVARHSGMRVFGMSVVTNICNTTNEATTLNDGEDVIIAGNAAAGRMTAIFKRMIERL